MSSNRYVVNVSSPQTFANTLHKNMAYSMRIHWQHHICDANDKELVIPFPQSHGSHIKHRVEIGMQSFSGEFVRYDSSDNNSTSGIFPFPVEPGGKYVLWVVHYVNGAVTYFSHGKVTAAVRSYT